MVKSVYKGDFIITITLFQMYKAKTDNEKEKLTIHNPKGYFNTLLNKRTKKYRSGGHGKQNGPNWYVEDTVNNDRIHISLKPVFKIY